MKKHLLSIVAFASIALLGSADAFGKTIGIWTDARTFLRPGLTNSLVEAGWDIEWFSAGRNGNDLEKPEKLAKIDVLLLHGGWGRYFFPTSKARLEINRFAAGGKGVLACGFRSGYVRTANRPMFPEIGHTYNRCQSQWLSPVGDSPLAKAFEGETRAFSGIDHLCLKVGEWGNVFCKCGDDIVGAYGEYYNGRVVVFGSHFAYQITDDDTKEHTEKLLFAVLDYLMKPKAKMPVAEAMKLAEREFIRREMLWTYCADDRGPDRRPGLLVALRDQETSEVEAIAYKLEYYLSVLEKSGTPKNTLGKYRSSIIAMKTFAKNVRSYYAHVEKDLKNRLNKATPADVALSAALGDKFCDIKTVEKNLKQRVKQPEVEKAKRYLEELQPLVKAAKKAMLEKEIAKDLKKVPSLVQALSSKCPNERYNAALELGRISPDDKTAVDALIKALDDSESRVRTQVVTTLGWMQAKDAVAPLISKLSTADKFLYRRIIQALGLIGDVRAIPTVLKVLNEGEHISKVVAAISLGHLKAREAVPALRQLVENKKTRSELRLASILALGDIGDKSVLELIESIYASTKPPKPKRGVLKGDNYLSSSYEITTRNTAMLALKRLAKGGRAERGVKQMQEYRSYDMFYAITKKFNAFVGRPETTKGAFDGMGQKILWSHVKNAGFTGIHNAWGARFDYTPEEYIELVREADDLDLIWIDVMPGWERTNFASTEAMVSTYEDEGIAAFHGIWAEETWREVGGNNEQFIKFIEEKYGKDWKKTLNLTEQEYNKAMNMEQPGWIAFMTKGPNKPLEAGFEPPWDGVLRNLVLEFNMKLLEDGWRESQEYLHSRRKGLAQTFVVSTADPVKFLGGINIAEKIDSFGHESYESFGRASGYLMERYRNGGAARSVMTEQYNWYCPSNAHALRGFWQNAIHSKCYYNFALHQIFEQPSWYDNWSWERGRWDAAKEVFKRVEKTPELYAIKPSAANAAVIFSERSSSSVKEQIYFQCGVPIRNEHNTMAVWTALNQSQIQTDVLWAESLTPERLSKYKFIYLPTAKYLIQNEIDALRQWVKDGGTLVAEGTSSLFDGMSLKLRKNYALSDVFGCDWVETKFRTGDDADTYAARPRSRRSAYKVIPGLDRPVHIDDSIHRDKKPVKSIMKMKMLSDNGDVKMGSVIEMDAALGYDIVKPTSAKVLAVYEDGKSPAILVNEFGKGKAYFVTANYFAHAHITSRWEMMPGKLDFWQNVRETISGIYKASGYKPAVEVTGVSLEVEVSVDNHGDKYVVHMLDYDVTSQGVKGAKLTVPGDRKIKRIYYPGDKKDTVLKLEGRSAALRDFNVYDMFVIEFAD